MNVKAAKELMHLANWLTIIESVVAAGEQRYREDVIVQEACDSLMIKMGELATRLARYGVEPPEPVKWADAIANRNWITHQYDEIDRDVTWATLSVSVATWRQALMPLINEAQVLLASNP